MVLKELIFNSFLWEGSGGLERTDFNSFKGVVVLIELILTVFNLEGYGGLERTIFNSF